MYIKHGVHPIDIYIGYDNKMVFIFVKEETKIIYEKWLNYELS